MADREFILSEEKWYWGGGAARASAAMPCGSCSTGPSTSSPAQRDARDLDFNEAGLRAYEGAGFREIGRRRDAVLARGVRHDSTLMDAIPG